MFEYQATILRVVDGDTVDVDIDLGFDMWLKKQRIRLAGVDTPESRTRDKKEKECGLLAKKFVEENLMVGYKYTLKTKEKGKYGRYLGTFSCPHGDICELLISNFHAVPYFGQSKKDIQLSHLENRKRLIEKGLLSK